jgi:hypothetical protein
MNIRNKAYSLLVTALCMTVVSTPTHARSYSSGSASTSRGGSASWGGGSGSASGYRGGSAAWSNGSGYAHGAYGGSAAWSHPPSYGYHPTTLPAYGYHPPVPAYGYRPPVYYNNGGYSSGQVAAAGVAGLAVGAMVGAAAASNKAPPPPATVVVVQQPMAPAPMPLGTSLSYLPGGCVNINISSGQYYQCGINWFRPYFGSNGAYYQVVPAPY